MQKISFANERKEKLSGILAKPEGTGKFPCVIICHGLGSSKENKQPIMEAFAESGIASLAFDFMGHGESEGSFADLTISKVADDARAALDFVSGLDFVDARRLGVMGHSLGGSVSLIAAGRDKRIKAAAVSAPVTDFNETFKMLSDFDTRIGNLTVWKQKGYTHFYTSKGYMKLGYSFLEDASMHDQKEIAKKVKCPVLIISGSKDRVVPVSQSEAFIRLLKSEKEMKILDCGHSFEEKDMSSLIDLSCQWFLRWL